MTTHYSFDNAYDVISNIIDKSAQDVLTVRMTTSIKSERLHFGTFVGAFVEPDVFACVPSEDDWFDRHIQIEDERDDYLEHTYVCSGNIDVWSTIFRTPDGYIYVFGTDEREGFNDWNPTFELNCIGRVIRKKFSISPFSQTICKSFASASRNTYEFTVELYKGAFIAYAAKKKVSRTKFLKIRT